ncbi:hypothetical protein SaSA73_0710 [Streptococcus agalactiae]|nr:hypothetical protein SaSA73_0710 [Streptococcus agalactiae]
MISIIFANNYFILTTIVVKMKIICYNVFIKKKNNIKGEAC